jgi:hypothetical protein
MMIVASVSSIFLPFRKEDSEKISFAVTCMGLNQIQFITPYDKHWVCDDSEC